MSCKYKWVCDATDQELVEELFRRNDIVAFLSRCDTKNTITVNVNDSEKINGYTDGYSTFDFDKDGRLIIMEIWG